MRTKTVTARKTKAKRTGGVQLSAFMPVVNGTMAGAAFAVLAMLILAILLRYGIVAESLIPIANQVIKVLGIAIASYVSTRTPAAYPFIRGGVAGLCYVLAGIAIFSYIAGGFIFNMSQLYDCVMGVLVGGIFALLVGTKQ